LNQPAKKELGIRTGEKKRSRFKREGGQSLGNGERRADDVLPLWPLKKREVEKSNKIWREVGGS